MKSYADKVQEDYDRRMDGLMSLALIYGDAAVQEGITTAGTTEPAQVLAAIKEAQRDP